MMSASAAAVPASVAEEGISQGKILVSGGSECAEIEHTALGATISSETEKKILTDSKTMVEKGNDGAGVNGAADSTCGDAVEQLGPETIGSIVAPCSSYVTGSICCEVESVNGNDTVGNSVSLDNRQVGMPSSNTIDDTHAGGGATPRSDCERSGAASVSVGTETAVGCSPLVDAPMEGETSRDNEATAEAASPVPHDTKTAGQEDATAGPTGSLSLDDLNSSKETAGESNSERIAKQPDKPADDEATSMSESSNEKWPPGGAFGVKETEQPDIQHRKRPRLSRKVCVSLLFSDKYAGTLLEAMGYIHRDRDALLAALLRCCGFLRDAPRFFSVVKPKLAGRRHMERFHSGQYLDMLEYPSPDSSNERMGHCGDNTRGLCSPDAKLTMPASDLTSDPSYIKILDSYGLVDDCPLPPTAEGRALLWRYCQSVAGASLQAAHLLVTGESNVAINWGGGRHHAHADRAGGFCYINDVVLAVQHLLKSSSKSESTLKRKVLYLDLDVHHADGVQSAFYDTDAVLTVSLHRSAPGFFPPSGGKPAEKGKYGTPGVGHNININLPQRLTDADFLDMVDRVLSKLIPSYDPHYVVLCVGADGIADDPLVGREDGWNLSPEGLAEAVRRVASAVAPSDNSRSQPSKQRKLLLLGGGGYDAPRTARTFLLSTAAACEGARPGMLWNELPGDIPRHDFFPRYGPGFELISEDAKSGLCHGRNEGTKASKSLACGDPVSDRSIRASGDEEYFRLLAEGRRTVDLAAIYINGKKENNRDSPGYKPQTFVDSNKDENGEQFSFGIKKKECCGKRGSGRRRKKGKKILGVNQSAVT